MSDEPAEPRLRESIVIACLEALDWEGLEVHLDTFTLDEAAGAISRVHQVGEVKVMHRVSTHSQWSGETPDADDFMRHLEDPLPLQIMMAHLSVEQAIFQIGPGLYAATHRPRRGEMTTDSLATLAGLTEAQIEAEMERVVAEAIAPMRAAIEGEGGDRSD